MRDAAKRKAYNSEYRKRNLERLKEYDRNRPNRLERNARQNEYYHKDKTRHVEWRREHYRKNREKILARRREQEKWCNRSPEQKKSHQERNKQYLAAHPERRRDYYNRWKSKHPEKYRLHWMLSNGVRRAKTKTAPIEQRSIGIFIAGVRASKFVKCYYCHKRTSGAKAHIDHIVPLSKGGPHSVENLCASCPRCNLSKGSKLLSDYIALGQQLLAL